MASKNRAPKEASKKKMSLSISKKRVRAGKEDNKEDVKVSVAEKEASSASAFSEEEEEDKEVEETNNDESESSSSEEEEEEESDDDIPVPQKKQKKSKNQDTESFSNAMNALLDTHLKAYDRKDPILIRSKKELKKFDEEKLEQKAKRLLLNEKKKKLTANRNRDLLPKDDANARQILQHEKQLKKTAQRGVIKLFNAILMTQTSTQLDMNNETGYLGLNKKKELVNEISKEKFLDLVQQVGKK
ncbi:hypothetical protein C6P40_001422 [Pichia californica]|uniref:Rrp15p-domain-containing protein n=1 Tax=Pichia californica TaxID=460514 RepID=A0A9P7BFG4_9ASCO|nr:hypothetical protein C6P42_001490 [[Candida] californica]KAG0688085.1 hypothetical protein C6P40_001422 [[Candida] californica]